MTELDVLYSRLLHLGFIVLKQAAFQQNQPWLDAELEMLHNVPSLIGEENVRRHEYYWLKERLHYIEWASAPGHEDAKSRMLTYYDPIWREMEPLIAELVEFPESSPH